MFRQMRRGKQLLGDAESRAILEQGSSGVLAVLGDEGYPYAVPLSYVYCGDRIYFHCAKEGHKLDAIQREPKASFCVIAEDTVIPEQYTTSYRSVIVFGKARVLEDEEEMLQSIRALAVKYAPKETEADREAAIRKDWKPLCMVALDIEQITGKEAIERVRARQNASV